MSSAQFVRVRLVLVAALVGGLVALHFWAAAPAGPGRPELGPPPPAVLHDFNPNPEPPVTSGIHGGSLPGGGAYAP